MSLLFSPLTIRQLTVEVVRAVRAEVGESIPVFVRFSASDLAEGGLEVDEVAQAAEWAIAAGADLTDVSTGGLVDRQRINIGPGDQVPQAAAIHAHTGALTTAVGVIVTGGQAEGILQGGHADAIFAGREWLRDPHFGLRAATELGEESEGLWPAQYLRARRRRS
ncbi:MAG: hypothetical protein QM607_03595 [Microbacterium sp.]